MTAVDSISTDSVFQENEQVCKQAHKLCKKSENWVKMTLQGVLWNKQILRVIGCEIKKLLAL